MPQEYSAVLKDLYCFLRVKTCSSSHCKMIHVGLKTSLWLTLLLLLFLIPKSCLHTKGSNSSSSSFLGRGAVELEDSQLLEDLDDLLKPNGRNSEKLRRPAAFTVSLSQSCLSPLSGTFQPVNSD